MQLERTQLARALVLPKKHYNPPAGAHHLIQ
jgi:hypothetical protein